MVHRMHVVAAAVLFVGHCVGDARIHPEAEQMTGEARVSKLSPSVTPPGAGAPWSGDMHPDLGLSSNPKCNMATLENCAPTYSQLKAAGQLWQCPAGTRSSGCCGADHCIQSNSTPTGGNPTCPGQLSDDSPCCCPADGCYTAPIFNTVIGVCKGAGCACGKSTAPGCAPEGLPERCGTVQVNGTSTTCTGSSVRCCFGANVTDLVPFYDRGTEAVINYWAAYQYDEANEVWQIQPESSFNTNGSRPPHNLTADKGGIGDEAWLAPQPGGAMFWSLGYYPTGVRGVGPPGAMFVLSTEQWWGGTWYMLNQLTLDRGPAVSLPQEECAVSNSNCWASGNAGEMDFLETPWDVPDLHDDPDYSKSYSTQYNQIGRCFNGGVNGGGFGSENFVTTSKPGAPTPMVYVAVVDSVGVWVYKIPADRVEDVWPGIGRTTISATVQKAPNAVPTAVNPCTDEYCLVFTSNCQASTVSDARAQGCGFNGDQGWCGNWMQKLADTGQPLVPGPNCIRDIRGGVTMPWCASMVDHTAPSPPPPGPPLPPTTACPRCTSAQCEALHCGWTAPYACAAGSAHGGCTSNASFWPSSTSCTGCCDTQVCNAADSRSSVHAHDAAAGV